MSAKPEFKSSVIQWIAASRAGADGHPEIEEWIAYQNGELSTPERERLQDHLTGCRECVDLLLEVESFLHLEGERPSPFEVAAFWRALRSAIREEDREKAASWPWQAAVSLAASLVLALGMFFWGFAQQGDVESLRAELARPQINALVLDGSNVTRGPNDGPGDVFELPGNAGSFTLLIYPPRGFADYEVEIVDRDQVLWRGRGFALDPLKGTLSLSVSRHLLAPGSYSLLIYGVDGSRRDKIREDTLRISPPADAIP